MTCVLASSLFAQNSLADCRKTYEEVLRSSDFQVEEGMAIATVGQGFGAAVGLVGYLVTGEEKAWLVSASGMALLGIATSVEGARNGKSVQQVLNLYTDASHGDGRTLRQVAKDLKVSKSVVLDLFKRHNSTKLYCSTKLASLGDIKKLMKEDMRAVATPTGAKVAAKLAQKTYEYTPETLARFAEAAQAAKGQRTAEAFSGQ